MNKEVITMIMDNLKGRREAFCSEADFQFELSKEIDNYFREKNEDVKILLEYYQLSNDKKPMHIDILVKLGKKLYPIELKYKTKGNYDKNKILQYKDKDGVYEFGLKNHGAHNISCYKYLCDINRIEKVKKVKPNFERGYAIMLTNDSCYWNPTDPSCIYHSFSLGIENNKKEKKLTGAKWQGQGAVSNCYGNFELDAKRTISWHEYSSIDQDRFENYSGDKNNICKFRYVICEID